MKQLKNKSISVLLNIATMLISITCIFPLIWLAYNSVKDKFEFMKTPSHFLLILNGETSGKRFNWEILYRRHLIRCLIRS